MVDAGAKMVSDDIYNMTSTISPTVTSSDNGTTDLILSIATFPYNPFRDQSVIDGALASLGIYSLLVFGFILIGGTYVLLSNAEPTRRLFGQSIERKMSLSKFGMYCMLLICLQAFVGLAMWIPLIVNYILYSLFVSSIIDSIAPTQDNVILYIGMALVYLIMADEFVWRMLVIGVSAKFVFIIFFLMIVPMTRKLGALIFGYYLLMVFMQLVIVALTIAGIGIIKTISIGLPEDVTHYLVLGIFLLVVALVMILGPVTIMKLVKFGGRLAMRV
ncbi:MAG: hypothetical protein JXA38_05670 [Methanosarcinaceae archaeon]|nr:hypothetical protein [Methanosarcinaceae archaeon]